MALHFDNKEFTKRRKAALKSMESMGLDALLMFRQESMYYLSGYDTFGYVFFQCMVLTSDDRLFLLTRSADLRSALHTSTLKERDITIWFDGEGVQPAHDLKKLLSQHHLQGKRLGVEYLAYGLSSYLGKQLDSALDDFADLSDASYLVSELRAIKSLSEIEYVRKAAELGDSAWAAAYGVFERGEGTYEGDILAAQQGAIFSGGGDYSGNEFILASGEDALLCRYKTGRRRLSGTDQLTLEWAGAYRHYHAAMMRTVTFGVVNDLQRRMFDATSGALLACESALCVGNSCGQVFDEHARVLDNAGFAEHRLAACGYSLGAVFAPNWMDYPHLYHGSEYIIQEGMVFFCHMILMDSVNKLAMCLGHTFLITQDGAEPLSKTPVEFINI